MFLLGEDKICWYCGKEKEDLIHYQGKQYCSECYKKEVDEVYKTLKDLDDSLKNEVNNNTNTSAFVPLMFVSYFISFISVCMGFYKMFSYNNSKYGNSVNAYVGGDAYNFIINAQYSTAWFVLAVLFAIIGFTFLYCHFNLCRIRNL